jgi:peptide/nickel transport system ATP-binding protein
VVERISHRVAFMYLGEIVEIGSRRTAFENPAIPISDPARGNVARPELKDEIQSPVRPINFIPPKRTYRIVGEDHVVQE